MRTIDAARLPAGDPDQIAAELRARFRTVYGRDAAGSWFAPGRANLNGEHIDFHGGRCLPMALQHGTYVAAAAREDGVLRLRTLDKSLDDGIVDLPADTFGPASGTESHSTPSWTRYVSGVLWALHEASTHNNHQNHDDEAGPAADFAIPAGFGADLLIYSTVPVGGGLSSSAALECASALAFIALGTPIGQENPGGQLDTALTDQHRAALAQLCMRAEVEVVGAGTGGLDQTVSLRAAEGQILSLDCRDFAIRRLNVSGLLRNHRLVAVDTGQAHWLGDGRFGARRAEAEAASALLGFAPREEAPPLRDALPEKPKKHDVQALLDEFDRNIEQLGTSELPHPHGGNHDAGACRRRLRHALLEMQRSEKLHSLLSEEAYGIAHMAAEIGEIMTAGHVSMRDEAEVSFDAADHVVDAVLSAGAVGARLTGGGFGGAVLVLVAQDRAEEALAAAAKTGKAIRFLDVAPSAPARTIT